MDETKRRVVVAELGRWGYDVVVVSRRPERATLPWWTRVTAWDDAPVDGSLAVVNLAGESVGGLWTRGRKRRILESRVDTTRQLVHAIADAAEPPAVFVCASGIDYAGDSADTVV